MKKEELSGALIALKQAIANEQDGRRFYQEAARKTTDKNGKKMFSFLVEEEEQHFNALVAEYEAISGGGMWIPLDSARRTTPSGASLALFPQAKDTAKEMIPPGASDLEALKLWTLKQRATICISGQAKKRRTLWARPYTTPWLRRRTNTSRCCRKATSTCPPRGCGFLTTLKSRPSMARSVFSLVRRS